MKRVAVLLAEGFEEVEAVTPVDFMRRAGIEVIVTGVKSLEVKGSRGITVKADRLLGELPEELDGIICPGGMPGSSNIAASHKAVTLIKRLFSEGRLTAAICAAPAVVLGAAGILSGKRFTGYPSTVEGVSGATAVNQRVVVDGNLITSQGPGTSAEFACALIRYLVGDQMAEEVFKSTLQK